MKNFKIAVAGTGYVGLSIATLLSQHHQVTAVDIVPEKVELINNRKSPIQDDYIEKYLAEKELNLTATLDAKAAYADADFVVIAAPTNVYSKRTVGYQGSAVLDEPEREAGTTSIPIPQREESENIPLPDLPGQLENVQQSGNEIAERGMPT